MQINIFTGYTEYDIADTDNAKYVLGRRLINYPERIGHPQNICDYIYRELMALQCQGCENVCITTMSKVVINFIAHLVHRGILDNKDIRIYITMKDNEIKEATYDEEGYLVGWPLGFFNFDTDEIIEKYKERYK